MEETDERKTYDINEVRDSSIEGIGEDERLELKETNNRIKKINMEINGIIHGTSERILNEVYFGG